MTISPINAIICKSDVGDVAEVLAFVCDERGRQGRTEIQFCDIYHSCHRYATGTSMVPIVLPRSIMWSFSRQRLLLGHELLAIQGHTVTQEQFKSVTENQMCDLAGNA